MALRIRQSGEAPPAVAGAVQLPALARRRQAIGRSSVGWAVLPLVLADAVCIAASMAVAYQLRFRMMEYLAYFSPAFYARLVLIAVPMWAFVSLIYGLYHPDNLFGGLREYASVINVCTVGLVGLVLYSFVDRRGEHEISRMWLAMVWLLSISSISLSRFGYRRLIYYLRRQGLLARRALIVGANAEGRAVLSQLRASPEAGIAVLGFVDQMQPPGTDVEGTPILGGSDRLADMVSRLAIDQLIVIPTALSRERLLDIYRDWGTDERVRVYLSSGLYELFTTGVKVSEAGFVPLVSLNRTRITGVDALMKATLDRLAAAVGCILLVFAFPFIALAIWLDSRGPVIHRRRVVGLHGRRFGAYKFRTMIHEADAYLEAHPDLKDEWERTGKIEDDPRITSVGRILRRYSIDELPQLFNVLRGQMSLVGPRMIAPSELRHFGRWRHNLLTVKPGMTGLWQVSGRADLCYEERVRLDMQYIRNYTLWLDIKLLFETARAIAFGRGAY